VDAEIFKSVNNKICDSKQRGTHQLGTDNLIFTYKKQENNTTGNVSINVTLRRDRATAVAVQKQYVLHILSVCL
jgi:hypothetical protein